MMQCHLYLWNTLLISHDHQSLLSSHMNTLVVYKFSIHVITLVFYKLSKDSIHLSKVCYRFSVCFFYWEAPFLFFDIIFHRYLIDVSETVDLGRGIPWMFPILVDIDTYRLYLSFRPIPTMSTDIDRCWHCNFLPRQFSNEKKNIKNQCWHNDLAMSKTNKLYCINTIHYRHIVTITIGLSCIFTKSQYSSS